VNDEEEARIAREVVMSRLPRWWRAHRQHRFMLEVDRFAIAYARWRESAREEALRPPPTPPIGYGSHQ